MKFPKSKIGVILVSLYIVFILGTAFFTFDDLNFKERFNQGIFLLLITFPWSMLFVQFRFSDIIFSKEILQDLLDSPYSNAIVLDKKVILGNRTQRVLLDNDKIIQMQNTPLIGAVGKGVGIAKFSSEHFNYLMIKAEEQFSSGNLKQSYYSLIGKNVLDKDFFIVDSKDYKLIEINTLEQLDMAERGLIRNVY